MKMKKWIGRGMFLAALCLCLSAGTVFCRCFTGVSPLGYLDPDELAAKQSGQLLLGSTEKANPRLGRRSTAYATMEAER